METIIILAEAYVKATKSNIIRLDIQFNTITEMYSGHLVLDNGIEFKIYENGEVKGEKTNEQH